MTAAPADAIDRLVGANFDAIRAERPQARDNAQASFVALFHPDDFGDFPVADRRAVAVFVAALHGQPAIAAFYAEALPEAWPSLLAAEAERGATHGPYGTFPAGPLSREDKAGKNYRVDATNRAVLGGRLAAALEHAHFLVLHPRDAAPERLQALLDAGWTTTGIVTLSQLVAFLSFQIRVVAGLRALAAAREATP